MVNNKIIKFEDTRFQKDILTLKLLCTKFQFQCMHICTRVTCHIIKEMKVQLEAFWSRDFCLERHSKWFHKAFYSILLGNSAAFLKGCRDLVMCGLKLNNPHQTDLWTGLMCLQKSKNISSKIYLKNTFVRLSFTLFVTDPVLILKMHRRPIRLKDV